MEVANKGLQLPPPAEPLGRPTTQQGNDPLSLFRWKPGLKCSGIKLNTKDGQAGRGALQLVRVKGEAYLRAQGLETLADLRSENHPSQENQHKVRNGGEDVGRWTQTKWESHVNIIFFTPNHSQERTILRMDSHIAISTRHIELGHKSTSAPSHNAFYKGVNRDILNWKGRFRNAVINTVALWRREIQDEAPFTRLVAFRDNSKTADVQVGIRRNSKGASDPSMWNLRLKVSIYDWWVDQGRSHVRRGWPQSDWRGLKTNVKTLPETSKNVGSCCLIRIVTQLSLEVGKLQRGD